MENESIKSDQEDYKVKYMYFDAVVFVLDNFAHIY